MSKDKMVKYVVSLQHIQDYTMEVVASSEDEALRLADKRAKSLLKAESTKIQKVGFDSVESFLAQKKG